MGVFHQKYYKISAESIIYSLALLLLFYLFSPFGTEQSFIWINQIELTIVVASTFIICVIFVLIRSKKLSKFLRPLSLIDMLSFIYLLYLMSKLVFSTIDNAYIYKISSLSAFYLIVRNIPLTHTSYFIYLLPLCVIIQCIYGFNQLTEPWQGLADIKGTFFNTGIFGGFVAIGFISIIGGIFLIKPQKYSLTKIFLALLAIPVGIQLIYSQSRAAWLSVIISILFLLSVYAKGKINFATLSTLKRIGLTCILALVCIFSLSKLYFFKQDSADGRILIWTATWNLFEEKPITGWGINGFQANYMFKQADYLQKHTDSRFAILADDIAYPFNEFLKILIEQGLIGFILIIIILYNAFINKNQRELSFDEYRLYKLIQALFLALIIFACFSYPFNFISFQILLIFCLATIAKAKKPYYRIIANLSVPKFFIKIIVFIVCLFCCVMLFSLYKYTETINRWNKVTMNFQYNKDAAIAELKELYPKLKYNASFVTGFGKMLNQAGYYAESTILLEEAIALRASAHTLILLGESYRQVGEYQKALDAWKTAAFMMPSLFEPHYHTARLLFELQHYDKAKQKVKELLNKKIKIDTPEIDRMKMDLQFILDYNPASE
jgi:O-antigen ligase